MAKVFSTDNQIVTLLIEKSRQNGGKLTWGDLDKIIQNFGLENDTDEIDEILSICEREGIEIINKDVALVPFDDFPLEEPENIDSDDIDMNFGYTRIDSGIRIDRYRGSAKYLTIPSRIDNLPVTSIDYSAFSWCESLIEVRIPASVKKIDYSAFEGCTSLTKVTISEGVKEIGKRAFKECTSLTEIKIPESVKKIGRLYGSCTFQDCRSLETIYISDSALSKKEIKHEIDFIRRQNPACKILPIPKE